MDSVIPSITEFHARRSQLGSLWQPFPAFNGRFALITVADAALAPPYQKLAGQGAAVVICGGTRARTSSTLP